MRSRIKSTKESLGSTKHTHTQTLFYEALQYSDEKGYVRPTQWKPGLQVSNTLCFYYYWALHGTVNKYNWRAGQSFQPHLSASFDFQLVTAAKGARDRVGVPTKITIFYRAPLFSKCLPKMHWMSLVDTFDSGFLVWCGQERTVFIHNRDTHSAEHTTIRGR